MLRAIAFYKANTMCLLILMLQKLTQLPLLEVLALAFRLRQYFAA